MIMSLSIFFFFFAFSNSARAEISSEGEEKRRVLYDTAMSFERCTSLKTTKKKILLYTPADGSELVYEY